MVEANGWIFTVSNEIFYSHDNKNYEVTGFEPDIKIEMNKKAFINGIDNILERTIETNIKNLNQIFFK